jgi:hypothetical protein
MASFRFHLHLGCRGMSGFPELVLGRLSSQSLRINLETQVYPYQVGCGLYFVVHGSCQGSKKISVQLVELVLCTRLEVDSDDEPLEDSVAFAAVMMRAKSRCRSTADARHSPVSL